MEGITVYFKPKGKDKYETRFYSILSTNKTQDGQVVYANTKMILEDLKDELEDGSDFDVQSAKLELHEDTDGCAEQYRSATSLYMLSKLAFENDLVYCRAIDAEGHGKKSIDGLSGNDKADLDKALRGLVEYQPRQGGDTRGRRTAGDDGEGSSTASGEEEDGDKNAEVT